MNRYMLGRLMEEIVKVPEAALGTLTTLAEKLAGEKTTETLKELKKFNRGEPCWVKMGWSDLIGFFMTCPYLEVFGGFMEKILRPAFCTSLAPKAKVGVPHNLDQAIPSTMLCRKLGDNYVFQNTYAFCAYFAEAIQLQYDGRCGDFSVDGGRNIFFVCVESRVYTVTARWRGARHGTPEWSIDATSDVECSKGDRVFLCADTKAA